MIELSLIPGSGKPQDLNLEAITNLKLAEVAEQWLDDMVENMRMQADEPEDENEPGQRKRLHGAIAKTTTRLGLVKEIKARLKMDWYEAFYLAARQELEPEDLKYIEAKAHSLMQ